MTAVRCQRIKALDSQPAHQNEPERTSPEIQNNQWTPDKALPALPDPPGDRPNTHFGSNNDQLPATVTQQPVTKETTNLSSSNNGLRLEDQFRAEEGADINSRKELLLQFIEKLKDPAVQGHEVPRNVIRMIHNFSKASPSEIADFIRALPGNPGNPEACCFCQHDYDDRLYKYTVDVEYFGVIPGWKEDMPPTGEDMMIMEITGWTQQQLYDGLKIVNERIDMDYCYGMLCGTCWLACVCGSLQREVKAQV
ncbi:Oidioi.mRNA.OKI2018_I69.chr1.g3103.t1.cds [Oikopleura dioica]|uniref:Oidioi.mRNA.OKI2018_I69.chr1.g3103.t1.cds n=1 Tax=Oikopleura dioica TaxID=34765 RepID=A0ABN7SX14_OIKDI|nr:Oidioi.mRNA.OKI2018_I69.chr1.g3103.t1.cds [Oikopleura dioica]